MAFLDSFTGVQRAMTVAGFAPLVLLGCVIPQAKLPVLAAGMPAPTYSAMLPVPAPLPKPQPPMALAGAIEDLRDRFDGLAGISVRSIEGGWSIDSVDADRRLPQQSVSKLWVAMAVLDAVDTGRMSLDDPLVVTPADLTLFHQPIAALVRRDGAYRTTVRDLLNRAMTRSDNTANDRLLTAVGGPAAVRGFIQRKGLGDIRFGPGERLLQAGTAGMTWSQSYAAPRAFEQARARLTPDHRRAAYQRYVADPPDGATPAAIAAALAKLHRGEILSPTSTNWLLTTMNASRTGHARMRAGVPAGWILGHKTGTGQDLAGRTAGFNDVGILTAPDGRAYAVAIMVGDTARPVRDRQILMQQVIASVVAHHRG